MTITAADKLAAVEREIKMRQRVYPRWVAAGRMSQDQDYRRIVNQGDLFGDADANL